MSLLDTGREVVTVYPMVKSTDPDGNEIWGPSETGVDVRASVQPISSDEAAVNGQQVSTVYRVRPVRSSPVPVGPWAKVVWDGREWDVVGEPARHNSSPATRRVTFQIRGSTPKGT